MLDLYYFLPKPKKDSRGYELNGCPITVFKRGIAVCTTTALLFVYICCLSSGWTPGSSVGGFGGDGAQIHIQRLAVAADVYRAPCVLRNRNVCSLRSRS